MKHIDKEIYSQPNITKRLRPLSIGYWITAAAGVICTILFFANQNASSGLYALLMLGMAIGDFVLLMVLCYYLFGDSRGPYCKECNGFLNREFSYYSRQTRPALDEALSNGSLDALLRCKRGTIPDIVVVRYYDDEETLSYCQLLEMRNGKECPVSEVFRLTK